MTGSDTKAIKKFLLLLVFLAAVMMVFLYTAKKNVIDSTRVVIQPVAKKSRIVAWERLRDVHDDTKVEVRVNNARVIAAVMRSDAKRQRGLSGREGLAEHEGMMFIFDHEGSYAFWNKDMKFPIEVIWMAHGEVVGVSPLPAYDGTSPAIITPSSPSDAVLEVPAGFAKAQSIIAGNSVTIYENQ